MKYPEFLHEHGTLGFVAPSFGCAIEPYKSSFENALRRFGAMGYKTDVGPNCREGTGTGISSTPMRCGAELTDYYCSEKNDVLLSCGGGELMCETMDFVDFDRIRAAKPQWYLGYSDNTNFILPLLTMCDTAAIYGPCAPSFGTEPWCEPLFRAMSVLCGKTDKSAPMSFTMRGYEKYETESLRTEENPLAPYNFTESVLRRAYVGSNPAIIPQTAGDGGDVSYPDARVSASGRLIGGCLDILQLIAGTKYDHVREFAEKYKHDGLLWFIESCDLGPMAIRRALWQLDHLGWFEHASGFLFGRPFCNGEVYLGLDQYRAVYEPLGKYGVPIMMDLDFGHIPPAIPIISGSLGEAELVGNDFTLRMTLA